MNTLFRSKFARYFRVTINHKLNTELAFGSCILDKFKYNELYVEKVV